MSFWKHTIKALQTDNYLYFGWFFCILLVVLTAGAVHTATALLASIFALCFGILVLVRAFLHEPPQYATHNSDEGCFFDGWGFMGWALLVMLLFTAIQLIPLPLGVLQSIAPNAADLHQSVCLELENNTCWATITQSPGFTSFFIWILLGFFGIYATSTILFKRFYNARFGYYGLLALGFLGLLLTLVRTFYTDAGLMGEQGVRALWQIGGLINPNHAASFLGAMSLLSLGAALYKSGTRRLFGVLLYLLFAVTMVMQLSRGGIIAWAVAHLVMLVILAVRRKRFPASIAAVFLLLIGCVFAIVCSLSMQTVSELQNQYAETQILPNSEDEFIHNEEFDSKSRAIFEKTEMYPDFVKIIRDNPILGIGRGSFGDVYPKYQHFAFPKHFFHAENEFFELLMEYGLLSGILIFALVAAFFVRALRNPNQRKIEKGFELGALTVLIFLLIQNTLDFNLRYLATGSIFFTLSGMITARRQWQQYALSELPQNNKPTHKKATFYIGLAIVALATTLGIIHFSNGVQSFSRQDVFALSECLQDRNCAKNATEWMQKSQPTLLQHPASGHLHSLVGYGFATFARLESQTNPTLPLVAQNWYKAAKERAPMYAQTYLFSGSLHRYQGETQEAAQNYIQSANLDQRKSTTAMRLLANLDFSWFDNTSLPESLYDVTLLAQYLLEQHKYYETLRVSDVIIQKYPKELEGYSIAIQCYRKMQILQAATHILQAMSENLPNDIRAFNMEITFLLETEQIPLAFKKLQASQDLYAKESDYWVTSALVTILYGESLGEEWYTKHAQNSLQQLKKYIFDSEKIRSQYYWLNGEFLLKTGKTKEAITYFERSSEKQALKYLTESKTSPKP